MNKPKGRHELKHYINYSDVLQLRSKLPFVARPDANSKIGKGYRVRSLYFDNYNDKALREKIDGVNDREKFRIRFYNDNISFIKLEKKSKRNGICFKESVLVSDKLCRRLMGGDLTALKENGSDLYMELYTKMCYQQIRPKNIVDYQREAFVYPAGNVRITIDYDIRGDFNIHSFLIPGCMPVPISNLYILEVKYDNYLPEIIRGMVGLSGRRSAAFSKYAVTRIV